MAQVHSGTIRRRTRMRIVTRKEPPMLTSREGELPKIPQELLDLAAEWRMHVINVMCDESETTGDEPTAINFAAIVPFVPRAGDIILLEDGTECQVERSYFKVAAKREEKKI